MATLFKTHFNFYSLGKAGYNSKGEFITADVSSRSIKGTIQPISGKETVPAIAANRNTGTIKIYSTERLDFRSEDGQNLGYVKSGGFWYEIVDEAPYQNLDIIKHYKYIACLVPQSQIPTALGAL